jgi:hypothetical protein
VKYSCWFPDVLGLRATVVALVVAMPMACEATAQETTQTGQAAGLFVDDSNHHDPAEHWMREIPALADPVHARRQLAHQRLIQGGQPALEALRRFQQSDVLELRLATAQLIDSLENQHLEQSIAALCSGPAPTGEIDLPGWALFRGAAGDSQDARRLFVQLVRGHHGTLCWLDSLDDREEGQTIYMELDRYLPIDVSRINEGDPARWSLLLMASSHPTLGSAPILSSRVRGGLLNPQVSARLLGSPHHAAIRRLIDHWLQQSSRYYVNSTMLRIALAFECRDTARLMAKQTLTGAASAPTGIATSLTLLTRLEPQRAALELPKWIEDERVCHVWQIASVRRRAVQTEIRDVAVAMLLHLDGIDPRSAGFVDIEADPQTIFSEFSMGFEDSQTRRLAHAKAHRLLQQIDSARFDGPMAAAAAEEKNGRGKISEDVFPRHTE